MATNTAGPTTPEKSTRRCQVTDNEKRSLRVLLAEQGKVRERKAAARRGEDPKHGGWGFEKRRLALMAEPGDPR